MRSARGSCPLLGAALQDALNWSGWPAASALARLRYISAATKKELSTSTTSAMTSGW